MIHALVVILAPMLTRSLFALCACLLAGTVHASAQDELKRFVDTVQDLSAAFTQTQFDESGKTLSTSSGRMWLSRPGRFRWDYKTPYAQLMVCDGDRIWVYDPDLAQVTVRPAKEALAGTPAELLSQKALLSEAFTLEDLGTDNGVAALRLTPRAADSDFKAIELWLSGGVPRRMRFFDPLGGNTEVQFSDIKTGGKPEASLFRFSVPKGVEVVEGPAR